MAKSKWPDVKEKLILVEAWCRDGLTEEQIAAKLGIGVSTLSKYKVEHMEIVEALKGAKKLLMLKSRIRYIKEQMDINTMRLQESLLSPGICTMSR